MSRVAALIGLAPRVVRRCPPIVLRDVETGGAESVAGLISGDDRRSCVNTATAEGAGSSPAAGGSPRSSGVPGYGAQAKSLETWRTLGSNGRSGLRRPRRLSMPQPLSHLRRRLNALLEYVLLLRGGSVKW